MAVYSYQTGIDGGNNLFKLFSSKNSGEIYSFSYNQSSSFYVESIDYGLLSEDSFLDYTIFDFADDLIGDYKDYNLNLPPDTEFENYGSITETATLFDNYGSISGTSNPASIGLKKISSTSKYSIARASEIQGITFLFQGKSKVYISSSHIGYGILSYSGNLLSEKNTESYVGSGSLFGLIGTAERVVASYNNSSVISFESIDYGLLSEEPFASYSIDEFANNEIDEYKDYTLDLPPDTILEDYGSILDNANLTSERDDYGFISGRGLRPYGSLEIFGTSLEKNTESYVGSGSLGIAGDVEVFVLPVHIGSGVIKVSGSATNIKNTESYVGSGSLFGLGGKVEKVTFSYNESSVVSLETIDHGLLSEEPFASYDISEFSEEFIETYQNYTLDLPPDTILEDYGSILDNPNLSSERDDYGFISGRGLRPYGSLEIFGTSIEKNTESYVGSGSLGIAGNVEVFVLPIHIGSGVIKVSGSATNIKKTDSYVGSGSLFGFGSKVEKVSFSYNESSVVSLETIDHGLLSEEPFASYSIDEFANNEIQEYKEYTLDLPPDTILEDYGSILDNPNLSSERDDYGFITGRGLRPYGSLEIFGTSIEKNTDSYVGSGFLNVNGNVEVFVLPVHIGSGFIEVSGTSIEKNTESYVGSGSIFSFFGSSESETNVETGLSLFRFSGSLKESITPATHIGSGSIFSFFGSSESETNTESGSGLFRFLGTSIEKNTDSYVGSGSLFGFGGKVEKVTFSYNESSIVSLETIDYGLLSEEPFASYSISEFSEEFIETYQNYTLDLPPDTILEDYGSILDNPNLSSERDDYGFITGRGLRPYGSLEIFGTSIEKNTDSYVGSGFLNVNGNVEVFVLPVHIGSGFIEVSGTSIEKNTESYVGSGSIFSFFGSSESETNVETGLSLFRFSGSLKESITPATHIGSGSIFSFFGSSESETNTESGSGLFRFSGTSIEKNVDSYVGSGSLFGLGGKVEKVTFSYNESSIVLLETIDHGLLSEEPFSSYDISEFANNEIEEYQNYTLDLPPDTILEDYGSILDNPNLSSERDDYGFITGRGLRPYGSLEIFGTSIEKNTDSYVGSGSLGIAGNVEVFVLPIHIGSGVIKVSGTSIEKNTESYVGSGSIFSFFGSSESETNVEIGNGLFRFSGTSIEKNTESYVGSGSIFSFFGSSESETNTESGSGLFRLSGSATNIKKTDSYVGSGSLFGLGGKVEKVTFSYNESSVVSLETIDYGLLSEEPFASYDISEFANNEIEEYKEYTLDLPPDTILEDYGSILDNPNLSSERDDYGFISGRGLRPYGSIEIFGTSFDPIITLSHIGSGSVKAYNDESLIIIRFIYPGSGTIDIDGNGLESRIYPTYIGSGSLFGFDGATESETNVEIGNGLFRFSGTSIEKNTESYVGSGSIFSFFGSSESETNTESGSGLFKINGSLKESITPATHIGSGSIFSFFGSSESETNTESGSGLFRFSGTSIEKNTESYVGSGSIFSFFGSSESETNTESGSGLFKINGSSKESITPATHIGSGSIFSFFGSSESETNVETGTGLFRFSGTSIEKNTDSYIGSGSIFSFFGSSESETNTESGSGLFRFSGTSIEKNTESYVGSGSIFSFFGSSESESNTESGSGLFKINGSSKESITPATHIGSGSIFSFFGSSESETNVETGTGLFRFSGTLKESITPATHIGFGSLFGFDGATESETNTESGSGLFRFLGTSIEKNTESYVGSGSLFGFDGATESETNTESGSGLFRFSGTSIEKNTESYVGSGSIFSFFGSSESESNVESGSGLFRFSGTSIEKNTESYVGSGSIFSFFGSSESETNVETGTGLFRFSGTSIEKNTESYVGSGSIFSFFGSSESETNTESGSGLFRFSGTSIEKNTESYVGSGSLFGFDGATESETNTESGSGLFRFSGTSIEKNVDSYVGSGSIFSFFGSSESETNTESGSGLFRFSGTLFESFTRTNYDGFAFITIDGQSQNKKISYIPPRPPRILII